MGANLRTRTINIFNNNTAQTYSEMQTDFIRQIERIVIWQGREYIR